MRNVQYAASDCILFSEDKRLLLTAMDKIIDNRKENCATKTSIALTCTLENIFICPIFRSVSISRYYNISDLINAVFEKFYDIMNRSSVLGLSFDRIIDIKVIIHN